MKGTNTAISPFVTETVWNAGLSATGVAGDDRSLTVGRDGDWPPEQLLLLAAESCFMSTLLTLAADEGVDVLGYVSSAHLNVPSLPAEMPVISLAPCVVVASDEDAARIASCTRRAERESPVARLLGSQLRVAVDIRRLPEGGS
jgi:organic hydroperoxide reductase OsmC/OhrA